MYLQWNYMDKFMYLQWNYMRKLIRYHQIPMRKDEKTDGLS